MPSARRVPDGCFRADQSLESMKNRHGMPCRTVLEAAYSSERGKAQPARPIISAVTGAGPGAASLGHGRKQK